MARNFFNAENWLWKPLGYLGDLLILSLLWLICSFPLVTIGPATAALYDCVVHNLRRRETYLFGRFRETFKAELRIGLPSTLLWGGVLVLLFWLRSLLMARIGYVGLGGLIGMTSLILLLIPIGTAGWVFPLLSRFTFPFGALNGTAVRLGLGHILRTLVLGLLLLLTAELCLRFLVPVFVMPALTALLASLLIEPVFSRYEG